MATPNEAHGGAYRQFPARPDQYQEAAWEATLGQLFSTAVTHATDRIDWYDAKAAERAAVAKRIRFTSLLLFALGTLAPILLTFLVKIAAVGKTPNAPSTWLDIIAALPLAEIGYVLLAIAGALVVFDQFFDASGSWIRFRQSQARLEVLLADFRFTWAQAMAEAQGAVMGKETPVPFMSILRDFVIKIEWLAEDETKQWAKRFSQMIDTFDHNPNLKVSLSGAPGDQTGTAAALVQIAWGQIG
ncbi:SLATT domain-containing protein [Paraburkholderia sp. 35.1]|uniref:SLATT domain-containing protein n=1 Tax=Paraburkholderia sp. 35.1 TaxID=2991058 RepID=UPI003D208A59